METAEAVEEVRESRKVRSLICALRIQIFTCSFCRDVFEYPSENSRFALAVSEDLWD
jgi:hypothetical protein